MNTHRLPERAATAADNASETTSNILVAIITFVLPFLASVLWKTGKKTYKIVAPSVERAFFTEDPALPEAFEVVDATDSPVSAEEDRLRRLEEVQSYLEKGLISAELAEKRREEIVGEI